MKSGAKGAGLDDTAERDAVSAPEGVGEGERSGNMKGTRPGDDGRELLGYGRSVSAQTAAAHFASTYPSATVGTDASGLLRDEIRRLRLHVELLQQGQARPSLDVPRRGRRPRTKGQGRQEGVVVACRGKHFGSLRNIGL